MPFLLSPAVAAGADYPDPAWPDLLPSAPVGDQRDVRSVPGCTAASIDCVDGVIDEMIDRWRPLDRSCDFRAVFALTYLRTTQGFRRALANNDPAFNDRSWVILLDAEFADLYFRAYDGYRQRQFAKVPPAWRIAFDAATDKETWAGQDIFLGMNAHIQRDLPVALYRIGLADKKGSSHREDHNRVNRILARVLDPIEREVSRRYDPIVGRLDQDAGPGDEVGALQTVKSWREGAWRNAERLASAPDKESRKRVMESIEQYAEAWAELIL